MGIADRLNKCLNKMCMSMQQILGVLRFFLQTAVCVNEAARSNNLKHPCANDRMTPL